MDRRQFLAGVGSVSLGLASAGCLGSGSSSGDYDVGMSTRDFLPSELVVPPGTTVTWQNTSGTGHTVTAYDGGQPDGAAYFASGGFDSEAAARSAWRSGAGGAVYQGETYEHTFETPGEHHYVCIPHEQAGMVGIVVVREGATPPE